MSRRGFQFSIESLNGHELFFQYDDEQRITSWRRRKSIFIEAEMPHPPRLTHVRADVDVTVEIEGTGDMWALPGTGGVSTFGQPGAGRNWWEALQGTPYSDRLIVHNDHGDHYSWEPAERMLLSEFRSLLGEVEEHFGKIS